MIIWIIVFVMLVFLLLKLLSKNSMMNNLPSTLYKYFNWNDLDSRKILTEQELYFCNASRWKNYGEFDFKFKPINQDALRNEIRNQVQEMERVDHKRYERWFNIHLHIYQIDFSKYTTLPSYEKDLYEVQVREDMIEKRVQDILTNPLVYEKATKQFYFQRTGIFSTSFTKESLQLWSWKQNYKGENNGNAVCIGLDLKKLRSKLDTIGNYTLGQVEYQKQKNEIDFMGMGNAFLINRLNSITYTLPKKFVNEIEKQKEIRILKFLTNDTSKKSPERFIKLEHDYITEIVIHANASDIAKQEIREVADAIGCTNLSSFNS